MELARRVIQKLLADLQKRGAALGLQLTITRLARPQLTVVERSKQEDNGSARSGCSVEVAAVMPRIAVPS